MSFDRGFIKWQPFNSVISNKVILNSIDSLENKIKPTLFPEELEKLNIKIRDAYYSKDKVHIVFYEAGKYKDICAYITKLCLNSSTIQINNNKTIAFSQIINID